MKVEVVIIIAELKKSHYSEFLTKPLLEAGNKKP